MEPTAPGKWSPAELTEHLSLTYDGVLRELAGGPAIRVRFTGLKLLVVRLTVMRRFLGQGFVPPGVRAPKEVVPLNANPDRNAALVRFQARAAEFERAITPRLGDRMGRVTHPFFGRLTMAQGLRFAEVHIRHHTKQMASISHQSAALG
jgi:hypothetical protein